MSNPKNPRMVKIVLQKAVCDRARMILPTYRAYDIPYLRANFLTESRLAFGRLAYGIKHWTEAARKIRLGRTEGAPENRLTAWKTDSLPGRFSLYTECTEYDIAVRKLCTIFLRLAIV